MKKGIVLWLFLFGAIISHAQLITIKDKSTGNPIEGVTLMSEEPRAFEVTNANGQANLTAFLNSERIVIRSSEYVTVMYGFAEIEAMYFKVELEPTNIQLDEVVVSANRWSLNAGDVPSRISTISSKDIALQNPQTAADLLALSGKVFIQKSQQGGGSPMIRGFATNRLLYTVDGVRMNTAIFRAGNIQNVISLDPFAVERTEVLFGPSSVSYGSDAIGGVMSFQTLTPQLSLTEDELVTGKAVMRYSSANNEKTGHFDINVGWKKWALVTSISSNDYGDLRMGSNGPEEYLRNEYVTRIDSTDVVVTNDDPRVQAPSGYSQVNLMQKVRFKPNEKWDFQYGFHYSETSSYSRYDRQLRYKNGLPRYGEWSYGPQKWMMNNLNFTHSGNNVVYDQMTIRLAQQSFEESRISRNFNADDREIRIEEVQAYSANVDFVKNTGKKNELFYGAEAVLNDVVSTGINEDISTGIKTDGAARYPNSDWNSFAIYLTDEYRFSDKFVVQAGVRYNQFQLNAQFDTTFYPFPFTEANINNAALTGSAGLVYKPTKKWNISANVARAFRSPNVDDLGKVFDSEPGAVVVPNPDLDAEYALNADVSIVRVFGESVKIDLTGYYTQLQNALVRRDFTLNGLDSIMYDGQLSKVQAIQNAAVANVYGVQAGIEIALPKGFGFSSDFNYQMGEEEMDDGTVSPSRHAAPMFGTTRLTYKANKLSMQLYAQYSGGFTHEQLSISERDKTEIYAIDENGNTFSPSWYTLNFKAYYDFTKNFAVSAGLENLTDQRYRPYSSGIVAPGRNFILSLRAKF